MFEFDDVDETDGEADETGAADIEVGAWCVAGLGAFDAAAGLDFPDELSSGKSGLDPGAFDPGGQEVVPANQVLSVPDEVASQAAQSLSEFDETPSAAPPPSSIDEALDAMTYDELVEAREQLVVGKEVSEYESLIDGVNPNFDPNVDNAYARNCGGCAFATWERLSGIDPQAQADWRNIGTIGGMEEACDMRFADCAPDQLEQFARSQGPGWHGMCAMEWPPDGETGHWVNLATSETGHVYVLDSQCGEVSLLRDYVQENPAIRYHVNVR